MNKDGVAAAFELIIEEVEAVASEIAEQGSRAFRDKDYDAAQQLGSSGKSLQDFRARVEALLEDWQSCIDVPTRQRFATPRFQDLFGDTSSPPISAPIKTTRKGHNKSPRTRLRVTFPDGHVIEEYYAADTFALVLSRLGLARIEGLGIMERNLPLVGNAKSDQYGQRRIEGKYVCTHSSTQEKKATLEVVAKRLGVPITVTIVG